MIKLRDKELVQRLTESYIRMLKDSSCLFDGYVEEDYEDWIENASEPVTVANLRAAGNAFAAQGNVTGAYIMYSKIRETILK